MCYSAEVSFLTWGFGMACAAFLAFTGQPIKSFLFPLVVTQMQLVEGLRWTHALPEPMLALLAKGVLYAQPAAGLVEAGQAQYILPYVIAQAVAEFLGGSRDLRFVVAEDGHFSWKWLPDVGVLLPYWIALLYAASIVFPRWVNAILLALLVYYLVFHLQYQTWGSLWCVSVNGLWLHYLLR